MSIENLLERIAVALEKLAGSDQFGQLPGPVPELVQPKKTRRIKDTAIPAQQAAEAVVDVIPGIAEAEPAANEVLSTPEEPAIKTGAELRAAAQGYITAADKTGPDMVGKLVAFIQSVAKIFNPAEPKLIKIPDAKVPEAAAMIASWCAKNGIKV